MSAPPAIAPAEAAPGAPDALAFSDRCPRCGGGFHCGVADTTGPCACTTLKLTPHTLAALRARYSTCLCLRCLKAVSEGADIAPQPDVANG